jgi:hypothetical protein
MDYNGDLCPPTPCNTPASIRGEELPLEQFAIGLSTNNEVNFLEAPSLKRKATELKEVRDDLRYRFERACQNADWQPGKPSNISKKNKSGQLIDYVIQHSITTRTDFDSRPQEEIINFLLMPNLDSILPRAFNFCAMQLRNKPFVPYDSEERPRLLLGLSVRVPKLRRFLLDIQKWSLKQYTLFFRCLFNVVNFYEKKRNCVWVWGPSNTGKSTLMASFIDAFFSSGVGRPDNNDRTSFKFNNCVNKRIIFWEEPAITPVNIEEVKCLMSGTTFSTDIKYQSSVEIRQTPVIVTSNNTPWHGMTSQEVMKTRCFIFKLCTVLTDDWLLQNSKEFFPFLKRDWQESFLECSTENYISNVNSSSECSVFHPGLKSEIIDLTLDD